jgi:probable phosphoglycerate mutase
MVIALIRHGQTDWNRAVRMQGRTDIPLNDEGRAQAREVVAELAESDWDVVVSSPLGRARETAAIIADGLGLELGPTYDGLTEQDFGDAEGMLVADVHDRWPNRDIPGAESDEAVAERGVAALEQIASDYPGQNVLAVAHGTLIRRTLSLISGHEAHDYPRLANVSSSQVCLDDGTWAVLTVGGAPFDEVRIDLDARAAQLAAELAS